MSSRGYRIHAGKEKAINIKGAKMVVTIAWMGLGDITLSEISWTEKDQYCMIALISKKTEIEKSESGVQG